MYCQSRSTVCPCRSINSSREKAFTFSGVNRKSCRIFARIPCANFALHHTNVFFVKLPSSGQMLIKCSVRSGTLKRLIERNSNTSAPLPRSLLCSLAWMTVSLRSSCLLPCLREKINKELSVPWIAFSSYLCSLRSGSSWCWKVLMWDKKKLTTILPNKCPHRWLHEQSVSLSPSKSADP